MVGRDGIEPPPLNADQGEELIVRQIFTMLSCGYKRTLCLWEKLNGRNKTDALLVIFAFVEEWRRNVSFNSTYFNLIFLKLCREPYQQKIQNKSVRSRNHKQYIIHLGKKVLYKKQNSFFHRYINLCPVVYILLLGLE